MKCYIAQDLLPLYCDNLTSQETNEDIEKHLLDCKNCSEMYENMKQKEDIIENINTNIEPLKKVKRTNIKRIIIISISSIIFLCTVFIFVFVGVIPIHSDKLDMELFYLSYNNYPDGSQGDVLQAVFTGNGNTLTSFPDIQTVRDENGNLTTYYEVTLCPAVKLPFKFDQREKQFVMPIIVPGNENDTLTVHCRDKTIVYKVSELIQKAKREEQ